MMLIKDVGQNDVNKVGIPAEYILSGGVVEWKIYKLGFVKQFIGILHSGYFCSLFESHLDIDT